MEVILSYLWSVIVVTLGQLVFLFAPLAILGTILHVLAKAVSSLGDSLLGRKGYYWTFGWLGTVVHELGHAIFCVIFRHRITEIKLLTLDTQGTLGYVNHSYDPDSLYQNIGTFFISIGPIILGSLVAYLSARFLLLPEIQSSLRELTVKGDSFLSLQAIWELLKEFSMAAYGFLRSFVENFDLTDWRLYLFLYIVGSVASSQELSSADLEGVWYGLGVIIGAVFMLNLLTLWTADMIGYVLSAEIFSFFVQEIGNPFASVLLVAILIGGMLAVVLTPLALIKMLFNRR